MSDNQIDIPKEKRIERAIRASSAARKVNIKYSDALIKQIKNRYGETRSYKRVMEEFHISSKGTLHYILKSR